ncbi:hypothetical protein AKJ51_03090 [candidate division MSBL1 archaeon SCGC-AAA382A20]|uniref:Transcriptional coactivator p15 (PC4) C-terminal domain-containing protein n=1 Tax=candidate division MSBL1 archaeon SCGC-AAA382A20 TaxID=1698280 RepID=A0A133VJU7_9EURY|nr:hypothetical protein AKJ51_03090 [candidate division MSBL1 archaeon SCGC-AAA382A20]
MGEEDVLVAEEIRKDDETLVKIQVKEFKGSYYFDIREWKDKGSYEGPTKKGVNLPLDRALSIGDKVKSVLEEAQEKMDEHVKKVKKEERKKDIGDLKSKYGSYS